jgi:DNA-binding SARP family transcriptional activator
MRGGAKQRALLAILLLHANEAMSSDRLIDDLWGSRPPETAANALQVYVAQLRKLLEPERARGAPSKVLTTRPGGYLLSVEPGGLDAERFEHLLAEGTRARVAADPGSAAKLLHEALNLWRGDALADFTYEPFAQAEIARLEELRLAALEERIEADLALGGHAAVVGELEALVWKILRSRSLSRPTSSSRHRGEGSKSRPRREALGGSGHRASLTGGW